MANKYKNIGCIADTTSEKAISAQKQLIELYNFHNLNESPNHECDLIVVLGGDGTMLKVLHKYMQQGIPVYGINCGSLGFLLNSYNLENLLEILEDAIEVKLHPLEMTATTMDKKVYNALAINEVSLLRETGQTAHIKVSVDGKTQISCLMGDGILVATAAGSTAYNLAANGPIIPLDANILALTPISPFRPRRWRGALLSCSSIVEFEILEPEKRPVSSVADSAEIRNVTKVKIQERREITLRLLFNKNDSLRERVLKEQFVH